MEWVQGKYNPFYCNYPAEDRTAKKIMEQRVIAMKDGVEKNKMTKWQYNRKSYCVMFRDQAKKTIVRFSTKWRDVYY